jgi:hypothetical protein
LQKIRILVPIPTLPRRASETTLIFKNIIPELEKKVEPHIIWVVYSPNKIIINQKKEHETILDIHDYKDFVEILEEVKPDIVYAMANYSLIDFAVSSASKYLGIPVLSKFMNKVAVISKNMKKSLITRIFENMSPTDDDDSEKKFMKRGRFFLYKWLFLVKTLSRTKRGKAKAFLTGLKILSYFANIGKQEGLPEFANTMHWIESEKRRNRLLEFGYDPKSLIVTGNPLYDHAFQKIKEFKEKKNEKPIILFVPLSYYEHGIITKIKNEENFKKIVNTLNKNKEIILKIKIHPSSQQLQYYEKMIKDINENIEVFREGDILKHVENSDVVISYSGFSSSHIFTLLFNKPLILCNFFEFDKGPLLKEEIAIECKDITKINKQILSTLKKNPISTEKVSKYINEFFYKTDGKSSERLSDVIIKLTKK